MAESVLAQVVARLQAALAATDSGEYATSRVRDYDVEVLFETIRRYGGRRDWAPTPENIEHLPGPVRRHILAQHTEIQRLQKLAIEARGEAITARKALADSRPRR